jgi:hypothetical protein
MIRKKWLIRFRLIMVVGFYYECKKINYSVLMLGFLRMRFVGGGTFCFEG